MNKKTDAIQDEPNANVPDDLVIVHRGIERRSEKTEERGEHGNAPP
jgi:hypothetical protein